MSSYVIDSMSTPSRKDFLLAIIKNTSSDEPHLRKDSYSMFKGHSHDDKQLLIQFKNDTAVYPAVGVGIGVDSKCPDNIINKVKFEYEKYPYHIEPVNYDYLKEFRGGGAKSKRRRKRKLLTRRNKKISSRQKTA